MNQEAAAHNTESGGTGSGASSMSTGMKAGYWITKVLLVVIFTIPVGWVPKLIMTGQSAELAERLSDVGGRGAVTGIGVIELITVILVLIPKTALIGAGVAAVVMLGAIGSHVVGPVGFEGPASMMFVFALVGLALSLAHGFLEMQKKKLSS